MGQFVSEERGRLEIGRGIALGGGDNNRFFGGGLAAFALLVHEALKFDGVDGESALGREELRHIEREAVGVVEFEGGGSGDGACGCGFGEDGETTIQRTAEALLFAADDAADDFLALLQLGEDAAQRFDDGSDELLEEAGWEAEFFSVEDSAAEDAADDVIAAFVTGENAVGDGAGDAARVVGEDTEGDVGLLLLGQPLTLGGDGAGVGFAGEGGDSCEERGEDIGFVVRGLGGEIGEAF